MCIRDSAYIDFSKMTISVVAVCSNVVKNGKPLIGYGFNSNGRYGQGHLIRERFAPRLLEANTNEILNDEGTNFDPTKLWNVTILSQSLFPSFQNQPTKNKNPFFIVVTIL